MQNQHGSAASRSKPWWIVAVIVAAPVIAVLFSAPGLVSSYLSDRTFERGPSRTVTARVVEYHGDGNGWDEYTVEFPAAGRTVTARVPDVHAITWKDAELPATSRIEYLADEPQQARFAGHSMFRERLDASVETAVFIVGLIWGTLLVAVVADRKTHV